MYSRYSDLRPKMHIEILYFENMSSINLQYKFNDIATIYRYNVDTISNARYNEDHVGDRLVA